MCVFIWIMIVLPLIIFRIREEKKNMLQQNRNVAIWIQYNFIFFFVRFVHVFFLHVNRWFCLFWCMFTVCTSLSCMRAATIEWPLSVQPLNYTLHAHTWLIYCLSQLNAQTCHTRHQNAAHRGIYFAIAPFYSLPQYKHESVRARASTYSTFFILFENAFGICKSGYFCFALCSF